jgi:hypothetical protein
MAFLHTGSLLAAAISCGGLPATATCFLCGRTLRQQVFLLPQIAKPKTELEYFQLFLTANLLNENESAMIPDAAEKIQKAKPLPTFSVQHK